MYRLFNYIYKENTLAKVVILIKKYEKYIESVVEIIIFK